MRRVLGFSLLAAVVTFCIVQDRVTAAGARRYVALQRAALAGRGPAVTIDEVMQPAVRRSVRAGVVAGAGVGAGAVILILAGRAFVVRLRAARDDSRAGFTGDA